MCVSHRLRQLVIDRYGCGADKVRVIPNFVAWNGGTGGQASADRERRRAALGLAGRKVFVYSGGAQSWQCVEETLLLVRRLRDVDSATFLLALTPAAPAFAAAARRHGLTDSDCLIRCASFAAVPEWLRLCDWGLCLRNGRLLNQVASPTKVVEYLHCGLSVVLTEHVGDFPEVVRRHGVGVVLPYSWLQTEHGLGRAAEQVLQTARPAAPGVYCAAAAPYSRDRVMSQWRAVLTAA